MTSQIKSYDYVENKIEIQGRQHYEMYEFDGQWDQNKEVPFVVEHILGKHTWQIGQKVYFSHLMWKKMNKADAIKWMKMVICRMSTKQTIVRRLIFQFDRRKTVDKVNSS